jgi:hypothetical protein
MRMSLVSSRLSIENAIGNVEAKRVLKAVTANQIAPAIITVHIGAWGVNRRNRYTNSRVDAAGTTMNVPNARGTHK